MLLFVMKLPLIVDVLPFASAAETEVLTHRLDAFVGHLLEVKDFTFETFFLFLKDLYVDDVARGTEWDKHYFVVWLGNAHAFSASVDDADVF